MSFLRKRQHRSKSDRRSRLDRRWIKSQYRGKDRRSGKDRRAQIELPGINQNLPVPEDGEPNKLAGLESLLFSNTIQLEAVTRLLLQKGVIAEDELLEMMKTVQAAYQANLESED